MAVAGSLIVKIGAEISDFEKNLSKADRRLSSVAGSMQRTGSALSMKLTAPLLALGTGLAKVGADAAETASKFEAVFGRSAGAMDAWVKQARKTIPATSSDLRAMTADIQNLLVPLGLAPQKAMQMTKSVATLSADLASFNNIPVDDALARIRSGLTGQYEPLLKFGVALNVATVTQEAMRLGLIKKGQALDAASRAEAAYSLILKATTAAQGDAARTADSTANQMKFAAANAREAGESFGMVLAPALGKVSQFTANLGAKLSETSDTTKRWIVYIAGAAAAIGPLTWAIGGAIKGGLALKGVVVGLTAVLGMAGLAGSLVVGGVLLGGLALLATYIWRSGEEARKAKREISDYKSALAGVTDQAALKVQIGGIDVARKQIADQLRAKKAQRDGLANGGLVSVSRSDTADLRTPEAARLDADITRLESQLHAVGAQARAARIQLAKLEAAGLTSPGTAPGSAPFEPMSKTALAELARAQADLSSGNTHRYFRPGHMQPRDMMVAGSVVTPSGTGGIMGADGQLPSKMDLMRTSVVNELKSVPQAIAQSLAGFLGPVFAKMGAGAATGGMLGATVGGAIGTGIGNRMGGVMGSLMGPLGGIAGSFIGAGIGSLVGKMFGKTKDRSDEAADAMRRLATTTERVNAALVNLPQGFKVAAARYAAAEAETVTPTPGGGQGGEAGMSLGASAVMAPSAAPVFDFRGSTFSLPSVTDPEQFLERIMDAVDRQTRRGGGGLLLGAAR